MGKHKIVIFIVLFTVIIVAGSAIYLIMSGSQWNTYSNDERGYKIKYPAEWRKEEDRLPDVSFLDEFINEEHNTTRAHISIRTDEYPPERIESYNNARDPESEKYVTIGGMQALVIEREERTTSDNQLYRTTKDYSFIKDDMFFDIKTVTFDVSILDPENSSDVPVKPLSFYEEVFEQMFASFTFF